MGADLGTVDVVAEADGSVVADSGDAVVFELKLESGLFPRTDCQIENKAPPGRPHSYQGSAELVDLRIRRTQAAP